MNVFSDRTRGQTQQIGMTGDAKGLIDVLGPTESLDQTGIHDHRKVRKVKRQPKELPLTSELRSKQAVSNWI
jgi:hypothetical protein